MEEDKTKSKNKIYIGIVVALIIVLAICGTIYYYNDYHSASSESKSSISNSTKTLTNKEDSDNETATLTRSVDEKNIESLINRPGYYKGYHMNKKSWITIILDDSVSDEEIFNLIEKANQSVTVAREWIVPANASYFDVIGYFNSHKVVDWKQTSDIRVNDLVYIYVGAPYSCLMYKCKAVKVGLPYSYKDSNVKMDYIMKLEVLGKYDNDKYTFNKLKELGVGAIRGPRTITKALSDELNKKSDC